MGKDRNKQSKQKNAPIQAPQGFSAEEWSHIIAKAIEKAEQNQRAEVNRRQEEERKVWQKAVGFGDYTNVHMPKRWLLEIFEILRVTWRLSFLPDSKIKGDRTTFALLQLILMLVFKLIDVVLLIGAACFAVVAIVFLYKRNVVQAITIVLYSISMMAISRIFRIVSIEIGKIEDRSYFFGVFACVMSIISLVVALVRR